jgi:hypothetical protein
MASRSRRNTRKPETTGMVDWTSLAVSDSDNSSAKRSGRRSRRSGTRGSSDPSASEAEPRYSTGEEDNSEPSQPVGRRSLRISTKQQEQNLDNGYMVDSDDDSESRPRRPGRPRTKQIQQTLTSGRSKRGWVLDDQRGQEIYPAATCGKDRKMRSLPTPRTRLAPK